MQKTDSIPKEAILEFAQIYFEKFDIKLSFEEAKVKAENFIKLFDLVTEKDSPSLSK